MCEASLSASRLGYDEWIKCHLCPECLCQCVPGHCLCAFHVHASDVSAASVKLAHHLPRHSCPDVLRWVSQHLTLF